MTHCSEAQRAASQRASWRASRARARSAPFGRLSTLTAANLYYALHKRGNLDRRVPRLGFTARELREHLERQFTAGMTWENHGAWHVDHIRPLSSFSYSSPDDDEFREAWALTNLRPLMAAENIKRSNGPERALFIARESVAG